jgi:hypothetical protein
LSGRATRGRFGRGNRRRNRRENQIRREINKQYSQATQVMGPGATTKNFEKIGEVPTNTEVRFDLNTVVGGDDFSSCCRHYRYLQILGVIVTQNDLNIPNEQNNVYVRVAWSQNYEEEEDIQSDDASKILPNIGRKSFMFKPPNAQVSYFRNSSTITMNLRQIIATEHLLQADDSYKIPGGVTLYNTTASSRKIRMIVRIRFVGNKVIDAVNEAKRVLKANGYLVMRALEGIKEEEVANKGGLKYRSKSV